ncbi:hypothetical protein EDD30_4985 [Couchioplanes caeruleus]|uniref:Uncharacterized protein n=1 Tax=Couchioplanes caeruleus TaxID=56438 RepID=A0A3N1GP88_9ACTN|nr:hypothetical protein EDD30_4985 [Couchioplanes caeruleus]
MLSSEKPGDTRAEDTTAPPAASEPELDEPAFRAIPRRRGLDPRTRGILVAAAVAAVIVNAGAMWAYWKITGSGSDSTGAGASVEMGLRGRSSLDVPLAPGSTGDLTVTVLNDNDFAIRVSSVAAGTGNVIADDEHRENGCERHGVSIARPDLAVRWEVARNDVAVFTVPGALRMAADADEACRGAVFTVPVRITGEARRP